MISTRLLETRRVCDVCLWARDRHGPVRSVSGDTRNTNPRQRKSYRDYSAITRGGGHEAEACSEARHGDARCGDLSTALVLLPVEALPRLVTPSPWPSSDLVSSSPYFRLHCSAVATSSPSPGTYSVFFGLRRLVIGIASVHLDLDPLDLHQPTSLVFTRAGLLFLLGLVAAHVTLQDLGDVAASNRLRGRLKCPYHPASAHRVRCVRTWRPQAPVVKLSVTRHKPQKGPLAPVRRPAQPPCAVRYSPSPRWTVPAQTSIHRAIFHRCTPLFFPLHTHYSGLEQNNNLAQQQITLLT
ncbi:hypothetical protein DFH08DRAFT_43661 [Mycena albidolilacea]|uniref:Uncharacterized protein n=1 Tax=Mycena albidolilacea TaxID=1033008 RepID=A0AAD7ABL5_9AGAR|nr:hypothetical protein DFH08DRAFT_43661 [Mycena albidolilacea]